MLKVRRKKNENESLSFAQIFPKKEEKKEKTANQSMFKAFGVNK